MSANSLPDLEYIRQRLHYDPLSGKLYWKARPDNPKKWNDRYAGLEAFTANHGSGYKVGAVDSKNYLAHRIVWAIHYGEWPDGEIDHIDHDRANNKIENLRCVSRVENCHNMSAYKTNTSGATGVYWFGARNKWKVEIWVARKKIHIGYYEDFHEAVTARKRASEYYRFHKNHGIQISGAA